MGSVAPAEALLALAVSLALQIGVNYANDYSDGIRGTDSDRVGPLRLVGSGVAAPRAVLTAALAAFAVAAVCGTALVAVSGHWWLLLVGVAAVAAAWFYTGGKRPYGYSGLGEVSVFVFFGLVAVLGTTYTQAGTVGPDTVAAAVAVGALACALLVVNNLRDIPTDAVAGKRTLAVRIGQRRTRVLFVVLLALPAVATVVAALTATPWALLGLAGVLLGIPPAGAVARGVAGRGLVAVLAATGRYQIVFGVLLGAGLSLA